MFETLALSEIPTPEGSGDPGIRYWDSVMRTSEVPWLVVRHRSQTGATAANVCLGSVAALPDFVERAARAGGVILRVQVMTPGWFNGTDDWQLKNLGELWIGKSPRHHMTVFKYGFENGEQRLCTVLGTPEPMMHDGVLVFRHNESKKVVA